MNRKEYPRICGNCKYFKRHELGKGIAYLSDGRCKRFPEPIAKDDADWCGEFAIVREPQIHKEGED